MHLQFRHMSDHFLHLHLKGVADTGHALIPKLLNTSSTRWIVGVLLARTLRSRLSNTNKVDMLPRPVALLQTCPPVQPCGKDSIAPSAPLMHMKDCYEPGP